MTKNYITDKDPWENVTELCERLHIEEEEFCHLFMNESKKFKSISDLIKEKHFLFPLRETSFALGNKEAHNVDGGFGLEDSIFMEKDSKIKLGNHVGFLKIGEDVIDIRSEFDKSNNNAYFLNYMIQQIVLGNQRVPLLNIDACFSNNPILDALILKFPNELNRAMEKGLYREYQTTYHHNSKLRGKIDIVNHLKRDIPFLGKFSYCTCEYSSKNRIFFLIYYTILEIEKHPFFREILYSRTLSSNICEQIQLVKRIVGISRPSLLDILKDNRQTSINHKYFIEYRDLQMLCLDILSHIRMNYTSGKTDNEISGILFDISWLFEEYVGTLIKGLFWHPSNKTGFGIHYMIADENRRLKPIFPDFISRDKEKRMILDVKYKLLESKSEINGGNGKAIDSKDVNQLMSYMYRFNTDLSFIIYPATTREQCKEFTIIDGSHLWGNEILKGKRKIVSIGMYIPQAVQCGEEFVQQMRVSENNILQVLKKYREEI